METSVDLPIAIIGSGFLRTALLRQLGTRCPGTRVRVLSPVAPDPVSGVHLEHVQGRLTDQSALYAALTGVGAAIHLGMEASSGHRGHTVSNPYTVNARGTAALTSAAITQGCRHVIYCSTADVYGDAPGRLLDEGDPVAPHTRPARAKVIGERLVEQFGTLPGRLSTIVRPFGLYGPGQPAGSTMGRILACALSGHPITLPGGGTQLRSFTYIDDVARGVIAALRRTNTAVAPHACYNIASLETFSIRDAAKLAISLIGGGSVVSVPRISSRRHSAHERPITVQIPSTERAANELGFRSTTLLTEGLSRCIPHAHLTAPARELVTA
ncbi:NAD-dependent epimerase/dehydratase family protein [Streptosporangium sp. NPDC087985]|uniref:NAD-dependent epimerase/dehydratase family protein n=1 Tax=Streptosporangium sp. NPDC087985 TaxID=3366196 RepID=UPI0038303394